jgi:hypothetical protein
MALIHPTTIKISKLDRRHTGNQWFTHRVMFDGAYPGKAINLCKAREWLWATFGPSREVSSIGYLSKEIPLWSWETNYSYFRLYLSEQALTQFLLIKEQFEQDYTY